MRERAMRSVEIDVALKSTFGLRVIAQYFSGTNFRPFNDATSS
jgi:hypothetical protein